VETVALDEAVELDVHAPDDDTRRRRWLIASLVGFAVLVGIVGLVIIGTTLDAGAAGGCGGG
jgi:hypothetical protein